MTIAIANQEIARFLESPEPEVLSVTGKWGVGKTYCWNSAVQSCKRNNSIALEKYCFASLYGLRSVDELKSAIIENTRPKSRIGEGFSIGDLLKPKEPASDWKQITKIRQFITPFIKREVDSAIQNLIFLGVKEQVIVLDDLERKSDSLKLREIFGLVTFLKESRNCKIALILNDSAFSGGDDQDFKMFYEKTIDTQLVLSPSPEDAIAIAFPNNSEVDAQLRIHFSALELTNIRVMQRLRRLAVRVEDEISALHPDVRGNILKSLAILGWARFGEDAPPVDFLRTRHSLVRKKENEELELKWSNRLQPFGSWYFTDAAKAVLSYIEQGYVNTSFKKEIQKLHSDFTANEAASAFHNAWTLYRQSFDDNESIIIPIMIEKFKDNMLHISPSSANATFLLLRDLDRDDVANDLIKKYIDTHDIDRFDRSRMFSDDDVTDEIFKHAIEEKRALTFDSRDPKQVLITIAHRRAWNEEDLVLLSKVTADQFEIMFKSIRDEDELAACIRFCLMMAQFANPSPQQRAIAEKAKSALHQIGTENRLNRRRVKMYGIEIDDQPEPNPTNTGSLS